MKNNLLNIFIILYVCCKNKITNKAIFRYELNIYDV